MRVLVTGPRAFTDRMALWNALEALKPDVIIHGEADGADTFAGHWAHNHRVAEFSKPFGKLLGKGGGPLRNAYLIEQYIPDLVVACRTTGPDRGTRDCMARAIERGIPVLQLWDRMYEN